MAKFVIKDPVVTINGVDLSDHISSATIETTRAEVDVTAFGSVNTETLAGLGDASMTFAVFQDFAAGEVDATLWPLSTSNTPVTVSVKHTNAATSATNPLYSMSALLFNYSPLDGAIGDASTTNVTFKNASQAGLTRATA
jgi:hypothetical protein